MKKNKANITETIIIVIIGIITILTTPPLPLLAIPFIMIITLRYIFSRLEENKMLSIKDKDEKKY